MRRSTILLTSEAALVAAMVGRMGWVDWFAAIHPALSIGVGLGAALTFIFICAAIFIGLPVLVLLGIVKAAIWLFGPVSFGDPA